MEQHGAALEQHRAEDPHERHEGDGERTPHDEAHDRVGAGAAAFVTAQAGAALGDDRLGRDDGS